MYPLYLQWVILQRTVPNSGCRLGSSPNATRNSSKTGERVEYLRLLTKAQEGILISFVSTLTAALRHWRMSKGSLYHVNKEELNWVISSTSLEPLQVTSYKLDTIISALASIITALQTTSGVSFISYDNTVFTYSFVFLKQILNRMVERSKR